MMKDSVRGAIIAQILKCLDEEERINPDWPCAPLDGASNVYERAKQVRNKAFSYTYERQPIEAVESITLKTIVACIRMLENLD